MRQRRALWVVLILAVALIMFSVAATNSPATRMDQEIKGILTTYGFEERPQISLGMFRDDYKQYRAMDMSDDDYQKILEVLESECSGCTVSSELVHSFSRRRKTITITASKRLVPYRLIKVEYTYDYSSSITDTRPYIDLTVEREYQVTLADRIRSMFP